MRRVDSHPRFSRSSPQQVAIPGRRWPALLLAGLTALLLSGCGPDKPVANEPTTQAAAAQQEAGTPASVVQACADLAKPGATLVFSTLNKTWKAYLMAIVGAEQLLKLVPKGTHEFEKFIRPSDLMRFIDDAGLQVVDATGLHYNPVNQSFRTGPGLDVNYFVVAKKPL